MDAIFTVRPEAVTGVRGHRAGHLWLTLETDGSTQLNINGRLSAWGGEPRYAEQAADIRRVLQALLMVLDAIDPADGDLDTHRMPFSWATPDADGAL